MKEITIIGAYQTRHGNHSDRLLRDLISEAGNGAIKNANIDRKEIQAVYVGNYAGQEFNSQNTMGSYAATILGLGNRPAQKLEGACASGGLAVRAGFLAVATWNLRHSTSFRCRKNEYQRSRNYYGNCSKRTRL